MNLGGSHRSIDEYLSFFPNQQCFLPGKKTQSEWHDSGLLTSTLTMDKGGSQKMIMFFTWKKCQREGQLKHHGDPSHLQRRSSFGLVRSSPDSQNHCWLFAASFARIFGSFITVVGRYFRWMGAFCPLRCRGGHFPILKGTVSLRISFFLTPDRYFLRQEQEQECSPDYITITNIYIIRRYRPQYWPYPFFLSPSCFSTEWVRTISNKGRHMEGRNILLFLL